MCRVGCDVFANGYRWDLEGVERTRCTECGAAEGGALHQIYHCPARAAARAALREEVDNLRAANWGRVEQGWRHAYRVRQVTTGKRMWPKLLDDRVPWWPGWGDPALIGEYPMQLVRPLAGSSLWIYKWHRGGAASARLSQG